MNISISYYSSTGGRRRNEDSVSLMESNGTVLGVVADGLGGHENGQIASRLAVQAMQEKLSHQSVTESLLRRAIAYANDKILEDASHAGMKTTLAAVWLDERGALAATVGDTRIYQFRENGILFQSRDHSAAQMAVYAGDITQEEIRGSKERHRLIRALGAQEQVKPDVCPLEIKSGDALLICSDGFWENIREQEMTGTLRRASSASEWLDGMRALFSSRKAGDCDNHSAIAILIL